jgi:hypothetical protein
MNRFKCRLENSSGIIDNIEFDRVPCIGERIYIQYPKDIVIRGYKVLDVVTQIIVSAYPANSVDNITHTLIVCRLN